jgi:tetratricopeptide (TPR) repeat protein
MQGRWDLAADKTPGFGPIAERFRRAGELERAIDLCREGLTRFPNHLSGRVTLGWALLDLGRYDEARVELERVLKRAPDNLAAIRGLAELHDRAENAMFVPAEPQAAAWPPTPAAAPQAIGWRDPDQLVASAPTPAAPAPAITPEVIAELPALLAELDGDPPDIAAADPLPVLPAATVSSDDLADIPSMAPVAEAVPAAEPVEALGATLDPAADVDATLLSLQAVIEELDAAETPSIAGAEAGAPAVAEFVAADVPNLDEVLSDLARADAADATAAAPDRPVLPPAVVEAEAEPVVLSPDSADVVLELPQQTEAEDVVEIASELFAEIGDEALPVPTVDLFDDLPASAGEGPLALDADAVPLAPLAGEPAIELSADADIEPLFDAAEDLDTAPRLDEAFAAAAAEASPAAIPVNLTPAELPIELDAIRPDPDADVPLDPAMFALASEAVDHAPPGVERIDDGVELDAAPVFEVAAPEQSLEFHEPEPALTTLPAHESYLEPPPATAGLDGPPVEFHVPDHAPAPVAREPQFEGGFDPSDDFASALKGESDFASPHVAMPEPVEADLPVAAGGFAPPVPAEQWPEPDQPVAPEEVSAIATAPDPPQDLEVRLEPMPAPALPEVAALPPDVAMAHGAATVAAGHLPPARRRSGSIPELERFLRQIERRKAALASESAA